MRLAQTYLDGDSNILPFGELFQDQWNKYKIKNFRKDYYSLFKSKGKKIFCKKFDKLSENYFREISKHTKRDYVLFDLSPMDFFVALFFFGVVHDLDEEYIDSKITSIRQWAHYFDIIFYHPISKVSSNEAILNNDLVRGIDLLLRDINKHYNSEGFVGVPKDDKPHWQELCGSPEIQLEHVKLFLNESGDMFGEDNNLVTSHFGDIEEFEISSEGHVIAPEIKQFEVDSFR